MNWLSTLLASIGAKAMQKLLTDLAKQAYAYVMKYIEMLGQSEATKKNAEELKQELAKENPEDEKLKQDSSNLLNGRH